MSLCQLFKLLPRISPSRMSQRSITSFFGKRSASDSPNEDQPKAKQAAVEAKPAAPIVPKPIPEAKKSSPNKLLNGNNNSTSSNSFCAPKDQAVKIELWIDLKDLEQQSLVKDTEYDPSIDNYHPYNHACWAPDQKVPYLALAKTLQHIEENSSRLKMIDILSNFFQSIICLTPEDLTQCVYLILNQLAPAYMGIELGLGESIIMKSICQATGRRMQDIKNDLVKVGDLGLVSEASRVNQGLLSKPAPLTVRSVFERLKSIAEMTGASTQNKKVEKVQSLIVSCRDCEARYIVRSLSGKLRVGLAEQSLLVALARSVVLVNHIKDKRTIDRESEKFKKELEEASHAIKTAYNCLPNYDRVIKNLLEQGVDKLEELCQSVISVPLKPMLAQPSKGVQEVLKKFSDTKFTCEYKYDGERAQIHRQEDGKCFIYSRNQEDTSGKYPDVLTEVGDYIRPETTAFILDCECVAWDVQDKRILPFQVLSTRKRKTAEGDDIKVKVCLFAFDLLHLNDRSLVKLPLSERRSLLHSSFIETPGKFMFAKAKDVDTTEEIQEILDESVKGQCEGLMVKALDSTYEISKRSQNWLKLKKDYLEGLGDTVDAVVIGGYYGKGKRTGNYGGFLLACYDDENEQYQTVCKLGTGFKDEDLSAHATFLNNHQIEKPKSYYVYDEGLAPDVWFDAVQVWEIKCADLSLSPIHRAAVGVLEDKKGISLRFPRYIRVRDDKKPEDATTASQVVNMYNSQEMMKEQ